MSKFLFSSGEKNRSALLHEEEVRYILEARHSGLTGRSLAEQFCVSESTISSIVNGHNWKYLQLPIVSFEELRIKKFWSLVDKKAPDECWPWFGNICRDTKYGRFGWRGKVVGAHCFSYQLAKGAIPKGKQVTHSCDNRRCVNPNHLFAKTNRENHEEMWIKGRGSPPPNTARKPGEGNPMHKLTANQVIEIRRRRYMGEKGMDLAKIFQVDPSTICQIYKRRGWKHVYAT